VEPAGGVVVAAARALARRGVFGADESVVLYLTGNAYKGSFATPRLTDVIDADSDEFRSAYAGVLG